MKNTNPSFFIQTLGAYPFFIIHFQDLWNKIFNKKKTAIFLRILILRDMYVNNHDLLQINWIEYFFYWVFNYSFFSSKFWDLYVIMFSHSEISCSNREREVTSNVWIQKKWIKMYQWKSKIVCSFSIDFNVETGNVGFDLNDVDLSNQLKTSIFHCENVEYKTHLCLTYLS